MKSFKEFRRYGADRKLKGINPITLKVDLDLESADPVHGFRFLGSAHRLTERDIWVKLTINSSKGSEASERTQN